MPLPVAQTMAAAGVALLALDAWPLFHALMHTKPSGSATPLGDEHAGACHPPTTALHSRRGCSAAGSCAAASAAITAKPRAVRLGAIDLLSSLLLDHSIGAPLEHLLELTLMPRFVDLLVEIGEVIAREAAAGGAAPVAAEPLAAVLLESLDSDHAAPTLVWNDSYRRSLEGFVVAELPRWIRRSRTQVALTVDSDGTRGSSGSSTSSV